MEPSTLLTQENESVPKELTEEDFEEHYISAEEVKKDPNAIFIEDNPQKALEKLLGLSVNDNYQERLQYIKHLAELMDAIGEEGIASFDKIISFIYQDRPDIKRAFLCQVTPLIMILQRYREQGYERIVNVVLSGVCTLLHAVHYDIKEAAAEQLAIIGEILTQEDREKHLLPQILTVGHDYRNEENRMIAARMLNKMGYLFGRDLCEQFIGAELLAMMEDLEFGVRREAVLYLPCTAKVVSSRFFGQKLLQPYFKLCKDANWEVRQACAQIIFNISSACIGEFTQTRESELTELMRALIKDSSNIVKMDAYKSLGPFISTLQGLKVHEKLIEYYLRMADKNLNNIAPDNEIMYACAYNFPAVFLTLGRLKWQVVKKLFRTLLKADARIKRPLACSLHEIAKILGEAGTEKYLLPVLHAFLKDSDDGVKYGVIKNLALFFKVFSNGKREQMIDILVDLLKDQIKWRIRELLAKQISKFTVLFSPETNFRIIAPITFKLCNDQVAAVREQAVKKIHALFKALYHLEPAYRDSIIENIKAFSHSNRYAARQSFILMCEKLMKDPQIFKAHFLESFIPLGNDKVPNVRLCVAKSLQKLFPGNNELCYDAEIIQLVKVMKKDHSAHVRDVLQTIRPDILSKSATLENILAEMSQPDMSQSMDSKDKGKGVGSRLEKAKMLLSKSSRKIQENEKDERGQELNA